MTKKKQEQKSLRIFVSSRMDELSAERKLVIEAIHRLGHIPLFVETQRELKPKDEIGNVETIKRMIESSDAVVCVHYLTFGKTYHYGTRFQTPTEFEYYYALHEKGLPCLFLRQHPPMGVNSAEKLNEFLKNTVTSDKKKKGLNQLLEYNDIIADAGSIEAREAIITALENWTKDLKPKYRSQRQIVDTYSVRYIGPDTEGLIYAFCEPIFWDFSLDLTFISLASRADGATLYITCKKSRLSVEKKYEWYDLRDRLLEIIPKILPQLDKKELETNIKPEDKIIIQVESPEGEESKKFYNAQLEMRIINTPGSLMAVTKVLKDMEFNIEEIIFKPSEYGHIKQVDLTLWLWHRNLPNKSLRGRCIYDLESSLSQSVVVRSFRCRFVDYTYTLDE